MNPACQPTDYRRWLWLLLSLTILVRAPGLFRPLLGNFATRNVVSAMVARNWVLGRASIWYPTTDCLPRKPLAKTADGPFSRDPPLPRTLIMLEFPLPTYAAGLLWHSLGGSLEAWGRGLSIALSMLSVLLLYRLVCLWHSPRAALVAAAALALSPVSVVYGQSFMLEAPLVCLQLAAVLGFELWLRRRQPRWLAFGGLALAMLLLTKIYMLVILLPLAGLLWQHRNSHERTRTGAIASIAIGLAVVPAGIWCWHVFETASPTNPLSERLFYSFQQSSAVHAFPHPLIFSIELYWRLAKDLATVALTPVGLALAVAGLWSAGSRRTMAWLVSGAALILALPLKFFELNYYWLTILPVFCILIGLGWDRIAARWQPPRWAIAGVAAVAILLCLRYCVRPAFLTPAEDRAVVAAGKAVQSLTSPEEPVVTMHGSCIDLLYYCDRAGWAVVATQESGDRGQGSGDRSQGSGVKEHLTTRLEQYSSRDARLLVVAGEEQFAKCPQARAAIWELPLVCQGEGFWIFRLPHERLAAQYGTH